MDFQSLHRRVTGNRSKMVDGILCRLEPEAVSEAVCRMMEDEKLRNRYREASLKKNVVYEKDMELLTGLLFR